MRIKFLVSLALLCNLWLPSIASAQTSDLIPNQYIVVLKQNDISSVGVKKATGENIRQIADRLVNEASLAGKQFDQSSKTSIQVVNEVKNVYKHVTKGFSVKLTQGAFQELKKSNEVDFVIQDRMAHAIAFQDPTESWGQDRVDQRNLPLNQVYQYNTTGLGVHAYVLDTGVRATHAEFAGRIGAGYDFIDNDATAEDCHGHGTHVAGTVAGTKYGIAKQAVIHPVRVLDCNGSGPYSVIIAGVDWVAGNHQKPAVANMSLGGSVYAPLNTAVNNAVAAGVSFAVAAGNENTDACTRSPASAANAITVASTTSSDQRSSFSNYGTCVDIFAPGSAIKSSWHSSNTATNTISGTSMASPHMAGIAALHLENYPQSTPAEVTASIKAGATPNKVADAKAGSPNILGYSILPGSQPPQSNFDELIPVTFLILN